MYRINDKLLNKHWIYLDENRLPIVIPCLFARYTQTIGKKIELKSIKNKITDLKEDFFEEVEIGDDATNKICSNLGRFLEWIENEYADHPYVKISTHTALPSDVINEYINYYLIEKLEKSEVVVNKAVQSLSVYYNWLQYFMGNKYKNISVFSSHRDLARANNKSVLVVKYLLEQTRELLYRKSTSLLEEIVLRNGGELGCRAKENRGFYLENFKANKIEHKGLITLFQELEYYPSKEVFQYYLSSLYTKYGRSRILYIPRALLSKMKLYYDVERPESNSRFLLVSNSRNSTKGQVISSSFATKTFQKVREKVRYEMLIYPEIYKYHQDISSENVYHHLRHSFGTDIFYNLCKGTNKSYESITTESSVFIETARRLGHKVDYKGKNTVTMDYIHACGQREELLVDAANG